MQRATDSANCSGAHLKRLPIYNNNLKEGQTDVDNYAKTKYFLTLLVVHIVNGFMVIFAGSAVCFSTLFYIMLSFPSLLFHLHKSAGIHALVFD